MPPKRITADGAGIFSKRETHVRDYLMSALFVAATWAAVIVSIRWLIGI
jgi:hypothetical protein